MKISNHFAVSELVHKDIISVLGEERAANIISPYLIKTLEKLRLRFGPIIVNNDRYSNSGVRKASYYKNKLGMMRQSFSTHQWGNTADLKFRDISPIEVYEFLLEHGNAFPYVVRMENAYETETWLHIECGQYKRSKEIEVFDP